MNKETFTLLCLWLRTNGGLIDSRHVLIKEQVAIFLWVINFDALIAIVIERFQHSIETISR